MKKILAAMFAISVIVLGTSAFAEPEATSLPTSEPILLPTTELLEGAEKPSETAAPEEVKIPEKELSTEFKLDIDVRHHKYIVSTNAVIELYTDDGEYLGSQLRYVGWDTPTVSMTFEVPEYRMGTYFKIKLAEGLRSIWYYGEMAQVGDSIRVQTYGYLDKNGEYVQNNGAAITANPPFEKEIKLYVTNKWYNDLSPRARVIDDVTMVPLRTVAEAMKLNVTYVPESDSVKCSIGGTAAFFWANNEYAALPGGGTNMPHRAEYIDGSLFVPARTLAEAFDCTIEATDYGENIDVLFGESPYVRKYYDNLYVNRSGVGSRTNYLVWVSKHEYKVRVYQGQQYYWEPIGEFPCALGAWDTPTITGQFEYIERTQWDYDTYYVGPVLRFYNGYALHSTLLYYGGGEYDGRVGVNISHGCVRLHPQDINWIAATIPFRTRIYITE